MKQTLKQSKMATREKIRRWDVAQAIAASPRNFHMHNIFRLQDATREKIERRACYSSEMCCRLDLQASVSLDNRCL